VRRYTATQLAAHLATQETQDFKSAYPFAKATRHEGKEDLSGKIHASCNLCMELNLKKRLEISNDRILTQTKKLM
jgi:hypothetical protein